MLRLLLLNRRYITHPHVKKAMPNATSHLAIVFLVAMFDLLVIYLMKCTIGYEEH